MSIYRKTPLKGDMKTRPLLKIAFVTLHEYRGGKGYSLLHKSCRLLARPDVFFHTGGSDADVGLSRVSKGTQAVTHQRLASLEFARRERLAVDEFLEVNASSRRSLKACKEDLLLAR